MELDMVNASVSRQFRRIFQLFMVDGKMHGIDWTPGSYIEEVCCNLRQGISLKWYPDGGLAEMHFIVEDGSMVFNENGLRPVIGMIYQVLIYFIFE